MTRLYEIKPNGVACGRGFSLLRGEPTSRVYRVSLCLLNNEVVTNASDGVNGRLYFLSRDRDECRIFIAFKTVHCCAIKCLLFTEERHWTRSRRCIFVASPARGSVPAQFRSMIAVSVISISCHQRVHYLINHYRRILFSALCGNVTRHNKGATNARRA